MNRHRVLTLVGFVPTWQKLPDPEESRDNLVFYWIGESPTFQQTLDKWSGLPLENPESAPPIESAPLIHRPHAHPSCPDKTPKQDQEDPLTTAQPVSKVSMLTKTIGMTAWAAIYMACAFLGFKQQFSPMSKIACAYDFSWETAFAYTDIRSGEATGWLFLSWACFNLPNLALCFMYSTDAERLEFSQLLTACIVLHFVCVSLGGFVSQLARYASVFFDIWLAYDLFSGFKSENPEFNIMIMGLKLIGDVLCCCVDFTVAVQFLFRWCCGTHAKNETVGRAAFHTSLFMFIVTYWLLIVVDAYFFARAWHGELSLKLWDLFA